MFVCVCVDTHGVFHFLELGFREIRKIRLHKQNENCQSYNSITKLVDVQV